MIVDPDKPSNIYVAGTGNAEDIGQLHEIGNIYKSTDYGETFIKINKGLPNDITQLELGKNSNKDSKTLYAAIYRNSIYKTTDEGNSWEKLDFPNQKIISLAVDPYNNKRIFAGTFL